MIYTVVFGFPTGKLLRWEGGCVHQFVYFSAIGVPLSPTVVEYLIAALLLAHRYWRPISDIV